MDSWQETATPVPAFLFIRHSPNAEVIAPREPEKLPKMAQVVEALVKKARRGTIKERKSAPG
jgi:hypothetical protein